jgi:hypothetical protein
MKRIWMLSAVALLAPAVALAASPGKVKYDPATVVTVTGTVVGEVRVDTSKGKKAVRLAVQTASGPVSVHLGPDAWMDRQSLRFAKGDEVTVKGSRFTFDDKTGIIAQSVARGPDRLVLRDDAGRPAWSKGAN